MLISTTLLQNTFKSIKKIQKQEHFSRNEREDIIDGSQKAYIYTVLVLSMIFFIFEFLLLVYCILIAIKCSSPGPERIIHIVLAITFTLPYALLSMFFSKCAIKTLSLDNTDNTDNTNNTNNTNNTTNINNTDNTTKPVSSF